MGLCFTLSQLSEMTMLTDRTLRNYLKRGLLRGEKTPAGWRFSHEEAIRFLNEPYVKAAVDTKHAAVVLDFLGRKIPTQGQMCLLWDLPASSLEEEERFRQALLSAVDSVPELTFSYSLEKGMIRVTLRGAPKDVLAVLPGLPPPSL